MKTKLVGLLALALGCTQSWDWEVPSIVTVTSAKVDENPERTEAVPLAIRDVAEATCDHERACLKVGPSNRWSSYDACVQTTHAQLAYTRCSDSNVRQSRLSSCIDDIRADPCVSTRASTLTIPSCTPEELCSAE